MLTILSVLLIIVSIIVIFAVLIQNPKGGGIAANFNFPTQIVGVQRSTDIIEKITWGFAVLIFVICIGNLKADL